MELERLIVLVQHRIQIIFLIKISILNTMKRQLLRLILLGETVSVSGDGVSTTDSTVTISKAGTYVISGESNGLQLKVDAEKEADIHIIF